MKIRKNISIIMVAILMFFVSFNSISVSAVEEETTTQVPILTATPNNEKNFVHLNWGFADENKNKDYSYRVYSKESSEKTFQSIPVKGNEKNPIKVLNVYPISRNSNPDSKDYNPNTVIKLEKFKNWRGEEFDLPESARLKRWMEEKIDGIEGAEKGFGKGIINVDSQGMDEFNSNADTNAEDLKKKLSKYDVIMFGSWDYNNFNDISDKAVLVVKNFIDSGRGVLFGHDTINSERHNRNFSDNFLDYLNMKLDGDYWGKNALKHGDGTEIKVCKSGLLTNYPWPIGEIGKKLSIPYTHTVGQIASGDIWMKFNIADDNNPCNSYLTTWNNVAMIQTGHSKGKATVDEQELLANTLFYLAQVTEDISWDDHKGQDVAAPTKPKITDVKYKDKKTTIAFDNSEDIGSTYKYYVEATERRPENGDKLGTGNKVKKVKSEEKEVTVTSGLKGYAVVVDQKKDTVPDAEKDLIGGKDIIKEDNNNLYTGDCDFNKDFYVHVAAVDNAGNMSEVSTYKYSCSTDISSQVVLNVEPNVDKLCNNGEFVVDLTINNIKDIYATETAVKYDSSKLKFLGFDNVNGIELVRHKEIDGQITLMLASLGDQNPMVGKSTLIKMKFKATNEGEAAIDVIKGEVAESHNNQRSLKDEECGKTKVTIFNKEFTLGDLADIAKNYGKDPKGVLEQGIDADLNHDGKIDKEDYNICSEIIMKNSSNDYEY